MPDRVEQPKPLQIGGTATSIGPRRGNFTPVPTPREAQDPIMAIIRLLGLNDLLGPSGGGVSGAMVGGLPNGLNPIAIEHAVKAAQGAAPRVGRAVATHGKAALDASSGAMKSIIDKALRNMPSGTRMEELYRKFGMSHPRTQELISESLK